MARLVGRLDDFVLPDDFLTNVKQCNVITENNDCVSLFRNSDIPLSRSVSDTVCNNFGYKMIDFCKNNNLYIVNGRVGSDKGVGALTCKNSSTVDYVLSSLELFQFFPDFKVLEYCNFYSDVHSPISFSIETCENAPGVRNTPVSTQPTVKLWSANSADAFCAQIDRPTVENIAEELLHLNSTKSVNKANINNVMSKLCNVFIATAEKSFGNKVSHMKSRKEGNKPWFNSTCRTARKKFHLVKRMHNCNKSNECKDVLKLASKSYKAVMDEAMKKYRTEMSNKIKTLRTSNTKEYWNILNTSNKSSKCSVDIKVFYEFFKSLNENQNKETIEDVSIQVNHVNEVLDCRITRDEIVKSINKLKNGKAPGSDNILNEHIKATMHIFLPLYEILFNIIFDTGIVPEEWLIGIIKPIFKNKGDPLSPENYRPITLLSCLGKMFTYILSSRLEDFADDSTLIKDSQMGFRKGFSTLDNIVILHFLSNMLINSKKKLFCAFIDFKQAFDTIWRDGLWSKLLKSGINGKCFSYIQNMYKDIKSKICANGMMSKFFDCNVGVRQGENLSPFLFSLYIKDLEDYLIEKKYCWSYNNY